MVCDEGGFGYFDFMDEFVILLLFGVVVGKVVLEIKCVFEVEFKGRVEDYFFLIIVKWFVSIDKILYIVILNFCYFELKVVCCFRNL